MGRGVEDGGIGPDDRLGAVAVVDVPVDDRDALGAMGALGVAGGDDGVVEQAEAHGLVGLGVMARRPDGAEGIGRLAGEHRVDREAGRAGRVRGGLEAPRRNPGIGVDLGDAVSGIAARTSAT